MDVLGLADDDDDDDDDDNGDVDDDGDDDCNFDNHGWIHQEMCFKSACMYF